MKPRVVQNNEEQNKNNERARKCAAARARLADIDRKIGDEWARIAPEFSRRDELNQRSQEIQRLIDEIDRILRDNRRPGAQRDMTPQERAELIEQRKRLLAEKQDIEREWGRSMDKLREKSRQGRLTSPELRRLDKLKEQAQQDIDKYCPSPKISDAPGTTMPAGQADEPTRDASLTRKLQAAHNDTATADTLLKPVADITEAEIGAVMDDPAYWREHRPDVVAKVGDWFGHVWGDAPVGRDGTGRGVPGAPVNPPPAAPRPLAAPDGRPVDLVLGALGRSLDRAARQTGEADAVRALQRGLNLAPRLAAAMVPSPTGPASPGAGGAGGAGGAPATDIGFVPLKVDGDLGNKTRKIARAAAARLGLPKLEEGLGLGRFQGFAEAAAGNAGTGNAGTGNADRIGAGGLGRALARDIGALFRERPRAGTASRVPVTARRPTPEAAALQEALNGLAETAGDRRTAGEPAAEIRVGDAGGSPLFPLKVDGLPGPKTEAGFRAALGRHGPAPVTAAFGQALGFLDPDEDAGAGGFGGSGFASGGFAG